MSLLENPLLFRRHRKVERSLDSLYRAKRRVHWEIKPIVSRKINFCSFYHINIKHPSINDISILYVEVHTFFQSWIFPKADTKRQIQHIVKRDETSPRGRKTGIFSQSGGSFILRVMTYHPSLRCILFKSCTEKKC